eukprot:448391_1
MAHVQPFDGDWFNMEFNLCRYHPKHKCIGIEIDDRTGCVMFNCNRATISSCTACALNLVIATRHLRKKTTQMKFVWYHTFIHITIFVSMVKHHIDIIKSFCKRKKYFQNFIIHMDLLLDDWNKIVDDLELSKQYNALLKSEGFEYEYASVGSIRAHLYDTLFQFFTCLNHPKHILWFIKLRKGYYFKKLIINGTDKLCKISVQKLEDAMNMNKGTQGLIPDVMYVIPVLQYLSSNHKLIASKLVTNNRKNKNNKHKYKIKKWLLDIFIHRKYAQNLYDGMWIDCLLNMGSIFKHQPYHWEIRSLAQMKCANYVCSNEYFPYKYGIVVDRENITQMTERYRAKEFTKINKFYKCSRCKMTRYCSKKCQKYHWKYEHRYSCQHLI